MENGEMITANIPILGQLQVGKSSLFSRLVYGEIKSELLQFTLPKKVFIDAYGYEIPRGVKFVENSCNNVLKLVFSDDPQCMISSSNIDGYLEGAAAVLFVFDVTDRGSALELPDYAERIRKSDNAVNVNQTWLIGNKIDQRDIFHGSVVDESVSAANGKELAEDLDCMGYIEVSAKTGEGIDVLFETIVNSFQPFFSD